MSYLNGFYLKIFSPMKRNSKKPVTIRASSINVIIIVFSSFIYPKSPLNEGAFIGCYLLFLGVFNIGCFTCIVLFT